MNIKNEILVHLSGVEERIKKALQETAPGVSIQQYRHLTEKNPDGITVWTKAFQTAIRENPVLSIPASQEPYYLDDTLVIPSDRVIRAEKGAVIRQTPGCKVLMLRNEHTVDGSRLPPQNLRPDRNIAILGGRWEESHRQRLGYGKSGMYNDKRSFFGVSACMLFNNMENLYLSDLEFAHTAGFSVQVGEIKGAVFENITFRECYADGLHLNGNTEDVVIRNIRGQVGDDLVALNMYDWQHSSVNFGPMKNVLCETLRLSEDSLYKALRIQPGMYFFEDGSQVDCSAENLIIRDVKGINTYKCYFQTPAYVIGTEPEKGGVGSGNNIFFQDIEVDLCRPLDYMPVYVNSDPVRGNFGAFEMGANLKNVYFESINARLYPEKYPLSGLISVGPKSVPGGNGEKEIFDPYLSSSIGNLHYKDIRINGTKINDLRPFVRLTSFQDINHDGHSTAGGTVAHFISEP